MFGKKMHSLLTVTNMRACVSDTSARTQADILYDLTRIVLRTEHKTQLPVWDGSKRGDAPASITGVAHRMEV